MGRKNSPSAKKQLATLITNYEKAKAENRQLYLDADQLADIADWYASERKFEEAQEVITYGLKIHPGNTALLIEQAYLYLDTQKLQKAKKVADSITEDFDSEVKLLKAELLLNGGKLEADGTYTIDFNSGDRLEGKIEAVFIPNPDSFFGYTLESVTGAEREESQEVQASVASPRIYSTNELGREHPETSAPETAPQTSASAEASNYTMARCDICSDETMCRSVWVEAFGESLMICDSCMVELQWIGQQVQAEMNE